MPSTLDFFFDWRGERPISGGLRKTKWLTFQSFCGIMVAKMRQRSKIMQELYNCKQVDSNHYKITKFDNHLNPKRDHTGRTSSYVVSEAGCDCPQGHAKSCRHRKMLPFFLEHKHVNSEYFFVWDTHQWYRAPGLSGPTTADEHWHVPKQDLNVNELCKAMDAVGIPTVVIGGGEQSPVSAAPSPQPSRVYRRF